jgi:hypothetical protein
MYWEIVSLLHYDPDKTGSFIDKINVNEDIEIDSSSSSEIINGSESLSSESFSSEFLSSESFSSEFLSSESFSSESFSSEDGYNS